MELKSDSVIGSYLKGGVYCGIMIERWKTDVRRDNTSQR